MGTRKKQGAEHFALRKVSTICDMEIPQHSAGETPEFEYVKIECGDVVSWNQKGQKFCLVQTTDFPDQRAISVSVFRTMADLVYYVKQVLTQYATMYTDAQIFTRKNMWHTMLNSWPYVKNRIVLYAE